jgi:predicted MFS family arabinose efflux permease
LALISRVLARATKRRRPTAALRRPTRGPSRNSLAGLDWLNFFIANVQTGFGPFIAVYLAGVGWTEFNIGSILSVAGLVGLITQLPGGALVDAVHSKRSIAALAALSITLSALLLALWPFYPVVLTAEILHGVASSLLGPAIAAISLGLVGHAAVGERLGRNARFASIGNGLAAAAMGACGYFLSARAVFFVTAVLLAPALVALRAMSANEIDPERCHGGLSRRRDNRPPTKFAELLRQRPLVILAGCVMLFHLANSAMLPLMASVVTMRSSQWATVLIAACIVVPQLVVAALSPWVGRRAGSWGRRPLLLLGFAALPVRGVLFATVKDPNLLVAVQLLDGLTASVFGVMVPLIIADLTRGTGHFNLGQGIVGTTTGIGASLSTTFAGYTSDHFGSEFAFLGLASVAVLGLAAVWFLLPETRPPRE